MTQISRKSFLLNLCTSAKSVDEISDSLKWDWLACKTNSRLDMIFKPIHMTAMTYTAARKNLASTMDRVCADHDPVIITRNCDQAVVMLSLDDYESLQETAYLLRTPANAKRLLASIGSLNLGKNIKKRSKDLVDT
jgi:antitoxin YefM